MLPRPPIITIVHLTVREAVRRRIVVAAALLTMAAVALTSWGFWKLAARDEPRGTSPGQTDLNVAMLVLVVAYGFSMVAAVGGAFLAAPAIAGEIDSGLLLAVLPRPIRRSDVVVGRWLGLVLMIAVYIGLTGTVELASIRAMTGYLPPHPARAIAFLIGETIVLMTLALLGSTRLAPLAGGIVAAALYGVAWIVGAAATIGESLGNEALATMGRITSCVLPTDGLWRGAAYYLEPDSVVAMLSVVGRATPFTASRPPPGGYLLWAAAWVAGILALAVFSFDRRDV